MLSYQKEAMLLDEFLRTLEYLLTANFIDVIADYFSYLSKAFSNQLLKHIIGYNQFVNEPTHVSGSQIINKVRCWTSLIKGYCSNHILF